MSDSMTPRAAQVRLAQYGEQATFTVATYGSGTERALHEIALTLSTEVDRLTAALDNLAGDLDKLNAEPVIA